jgi:GT2 family glycosyltransferase
MAVDVIMPVWILDEETLQLTKAAVESIKAGAPDCQMIIVDNGSTHGVGLIRDLADLYLRNKTNLGYAKAVNQGLKLAGEIVAVANNDIIVSPNWWKVARELFDDEPITGSLHYKMIAYGEPFKLGKNTWVTGKEKWCSSSFFVMHNGQLFDEEYLNSIDDWDFWRRFREAGNLTAYTNKAQYQHKDSHTQQKITNRAENDAKNRQHYFEKFGETPEQWLERMYPEQLDLPWKPMP